jgi:hypothetical protein
MARVLTTASTVDCGHAGGVTTSGEPKLRVDGAPVLLEAGIQGRGVGAPICPVVDEGSTLKCKTVTSVTGGRATKLRVSGAPVMLDTLSGETDGKAGGTPVRLLNATPGQTKLEAT